MHVLCQERVKETVAHTNLSLVRLCKVWPLFDYEPLPGRVQAVGVAAILLNYIPAAAATTLAWTGVAPRPYKIRF